MFYSYLQYDIFKFADSLDLLKQNFGNQSGLIIKRNDGHADTFDTNKAIENKGQIKGTDLFFVQSHRGILLKLSLMSTIHSNK